jgi:hypothetical protein
MAHSEVGRATSWGPVVPLQVLCPTLLQLEDTQPQGQELLDTQQEAGQVAEGPMQYICAIQTTEQGASEKGNMSPFMSLKLPSLALWSPLALGMDTVGICRGPEDLGPPMKHFPLWHPHDGL